LLLSSGGTAFILLFTDLRAQSGTQHFWFDPNPSNPDTVDAYSVAAFSLSSGTIGAALSSSLSRVRSIALSYGTVVHPTPTTYFQPAHDLGCQIISHLWDNWGKDGSGLRDGEVDLYSINIPLIEDILSDQGLDIYWTTMWRNSYGRLFKNIAEQHDESSSDKGTVSPAGPDAATNPTKTPTGPSPQRTDDTDLLFKWAPDMRGLIQPKEDELPVGSDGWAIHKGSVSVTPLRASFAEPPVEEAQPRRLKL
jgi:tubulin---tyrosine ligase